MHPPVMAFVAKHTHHASKVVEFGSLDINGSVRSLFPRADYLGIDRQEGPGVDIVCDITDFAAFFPRTMVVCTEVLEHAPDQRAIIAKADEVLVPAGHLVLTAACDPRRPHSGIDENPIRDFEHYRNVDPAELLTWLDGFEVCELDTSNLGDVYLCARKL